MVKVNSPLTSANRINVDESSRNFNPVYEESTPVPVAPLNTQAEGSNEVVDKLISTENIDISEK